MAKSPLMVKVIENTCTVVNKDKTVTLPTVQRSALSSAGETAGVVPFTIDLTSCTPGADVSVYFEKDSIRFHGGSTKKHSV
ncbi:fimbrial protein [Klebsiella pneumoniae]|uniref:Fimbrial protein n=1 Tax=Klebsiella pneumoniae TaxID=573 RepID=A0A4P0XZ53_KLEPN|nr:fimbrial protein [Klebsiella pneumoniae]